LKIFFRTLVVTALMAMATNICIGATASGSVIKKHESLIDKKRQAAIRPSHLLAKGAARIKAAHLDSALRGAAAVGNQNAGAGASGATAASASLAGAAPAPHATAADPRVPAVRMMPTPGAASPYTIINGTGIKHSASSLAVLGGSSMSKGSTAAVNGKSVQKKH